MTEAERKAWNAAIEAAAAHLDKMAHDTPVGHENGQHVASTYNWLTHHASIVRSLAKPEAE